MMHLNGTRHIFQAEYKCYGPGAYTIARAPWSKQLTEEEAERFMSIDFIDGQQWLPIWM